MSTDSDSPTRTVDPTLLDLLVCHPTQAAYILGPEKGSLSAGVQARCDHIIKIPTSFCINVGIAGAIVIYDRMISLGATAERPVRIGGPR